MKIIKFLVLTLMIVGIAVIGFLAYSGYFSGVQIVEKEVGPYYFIQVERWGDYKNTFKYIDSLKVALEKEGIKPERAFGIYYSDPEKVKTDSLHSIVGYILEPKDTARIIELKRKEFRIEVMGKTKSMVVDFPFRNQFSILIGINKVYPALKKYRSEKNFAPMPALEIYEKKNIQYSMEIKPN